MSTVLTEFVGLLVGGITSLAQGIASGANAMVTNLFLETGEGGAVTGLSTFGGVVAIFGGIALAVGFTTLIFRWIQNIGK